MSPTPAAAARPLQAPPPGSRRAEIALVAGEEFTRRGYHATRVEHIAERLAVTPGALYRHVPGKYEIFRDAVAILVSDLDAATAAPGDLDLLVESVTRTTLAHRSRAALYRWQARYLTAEDRAAVVAADTRVRRRFADAVRGRRRGGPVNGAGSAAGAILSCIASLAHHRIEISDPAAVALMTSIAADLASSAPVPAPAPPPAPGPEPAPAPPPASPPPPASTPPPRLRGGAATREGAIEAAIARIHSAGYDEVTMEAIGADVGVAASALYRHFPGKSALLTAAVDRTAAQVEQLLDRHAALRSPGADPAASLADLLDQYVAIAFSHGPELILYHSELGTLDPDDRRRLLRAQRGQLERWAGLVVEAARASGRGEPDVAAARLRVHAALAVVLDGGQGTGFHPAAAARYAQLARIPLLGGGDQGGGDQGGGDQASGSTAPRE